MTLKRQLIAIFVICAVATQALAWDWKLPAKRYAGMNAFERAQYGKAKKRLEGSQYRSAAAEFEKFKIQFEDSEFLPYVVFMRGYCLHMAKDRNKAIKIYNEVMDYFPDRIDEASAALYHIGLAHFENGDPREGMKAMKEMVEDEDYSQHPLAAGALVQLANNHIRNKEPEQAIRYWRQAIRDFGETNKEAARDARDRITAYCLQNKRMSSYDAWLSTDENAKDPKHRRQLADNAYAAARNGFQSGYNRFSKAQKKGDMQAFWEYFKAHKTWYERDSAHWSYHTKALDILTLIGKHKDTPAITNEAMAFIKAEKDKAKTLKMYVDLVARVPRGQILNDAVNQAAVLVSAIEDKQKADKEYSLLIDALRGARRFTEARMLTDRMSDRLLAAWKNYEILGHGENKWKEAAAKLEEIEKQGDAANQLKAKGTRAYVYKDMTREWDKAIKLYQEISNPPTTLWDIEYCYYHGGKIEDAIKVLTEIQSSFPDDAPRALWTKTSYYHSSGNRKQAVACARSLLKMYPRASWSSNAHELLEGYGIKTGGGVIDSEE